MLWSSRARGAKGSSTNPQHRALWWREPSGPVNCFNRSIIQVHSQQADRGRQLRTGQGAGHAPTVPSVRQPVRYDRGEYPYPQSVESEIIAGIGKIYGPYIGQCFATARETDIEQYRASVGSPRQRPVLGERGDESLVFTGYPQPDAGEASARVNRYEKGAKDAAEWQPRRNACWFANRTLEVRGKYGLSIDRREAVAIERTLAGCSSTEMVVLDCGLAAEPRNTPERLPPRENASDALERWDTNGNGQITCAEARRHGIATVSRDHPAYRFMRDGVGDGVVCE